jgi:hypothetical protein
VDTEAFQRELVQALTESEPRERLRAVAPRRLEQGAQQTELTEAVEQLRPAVTDVQEDELLDLLDAIVGWCSPGERLKP